MSQVTSFLVSFIGLSSCLNDLCDGSTREKADFLHLRRALWSAHPAGPHTLLRPRDLREDMGLQSVRVHACACVCTRACECACACVCVRVCGQPSFSKERGFTPSSRGRGAVGTSRHICVQEIPWVSIGSARPAEAEAVFVWGRAHDVTALGSQYFLSLFKNDNAYRVSDKSEAI